MNYPMLPQAPINSNRWSQRFQLVPLSRTESGFQYSSDFAPVDSFRPSRPDKGFRNDTVTQGRLNSSFSSGYLNGNDMGYLNDIATPHGTPADEDYGQSIRDFFANPYTPDTAYLKDALDRIAAARALYGSSAVKAPKKEAQKGDLRVIAGDRADGVKPKEIRIDDANNYDYQKAENSFQDNRQETRLKDATLGREYDITVTWADGSTTKKRVILKEPGQLVYMRDSYSY